MRDRVAINVTQKLGGYSDNQSRLSVDCCNCLKGIFSICVLVHHLYQHSGLFRETAVGTCLQALGYLSVACFFFLSGYGLYTSCNRKGEMYVKGFFKKKIMPFYGLIIFLTAIYIAEGIALGQTYSARVLIQSLTFGGTVIGNGWYLQVQLLLYVCFYLTFRISKSRKWNIIWIYCECSLYCIMMYNLGYSSTWFVTVFAFAAGMTWYKLETLINRTNRFAAIVSGIAFILFCSAFLGHHFVDSTIVALILMIFAVVSFAVFAATAVNIVPVENRATRWLGKYSLEIYVSQGLFLTFFHSQYINIVNQYIYILAVAVATLGAAVLLHPVVRKIYSIAREK